MSGFVDPSPNVCEHAAVLTRSEATDLTRRLLVEQPSFHGAGEAANWQLDGPLLEWLVGEVPLGGRSIETGCGYSTIVLGSLAAEHWTVSPVAVEHERIQSWARAAEVDLTSVHLLPDLSERALPTLDARIPDESIDVALVDGDHAWPMPALDWYYLAPMVRIGGMLVVDDVHIRACRDVARFLDADENWARRHQVGEAVVFTKVGAHVHARGVWRAQKWNRAVPSLDSRLRAVKGRVARLLGR